MAESIPGELAQAARSPIIEELSVALEELRPGFPVSLLQCLDSRPDSRVFEQLGFHAVYSLGSSCGRANCIVCDIDLSNGSYVAAERAIVPIWSST